MRVLWLARIALQDRCSMEMVFQACQAHCCDAVAQHASVPTKQTPKIGGVQVCLPVYRDLHALHDGRSVSVRQAVVDTGK
jgi:hypothetical protein